MHLHQVLHSARMTLAETWIHTMLTNKKSEQEPEFFKVAAFSPSQDLVEWVAQSEGNLAHTIHGP